jgi:hypothetical protein
MSVRGSGGVRTTERAEVWENPKVVDTRVAIVAS